jgi:transcriptional regulator with GAF, ATPase, and Fis domain
VRCRVAAAKLLRALQEGELQAGRRECGAARRVRVIAPPTVT